MRGIKRVLKVLTVFAPAVPYLLIAGACLYLAFAVKDGRALAAAVAFAGTALGYSTTNSRTGPRRGSARSGYHADTSGSDAAQTPTTDTPNGNPTRRTPRRRRR